MEPTSLFRIQDAKGQLVSLDAEEIVEGSLVWSDRRLTLYALLHDRNSR
jgi:hypothetical protein